MPTASPELSAQWPGMDEEAIAYLKLNGYTLTKQWYWIKPTPDHIPTDRERSAAQYLMDEWDFQGIEHNE